MTSLDYSDKEIQDTLKDLRSDKGSKQWMILEYENPKSGKLVVLEAGDEAEEFGWDEFTETLCDESSKILYGLFKTKGKRGGTRFVVVNYCGYASSADMLARKSGSYHNLFCFVGSLSDSRTISKFLFHHCSMTINARSEDDLLTYDELLKKLMTVSGANYSNL